MPTRKASRPIAKQACALMFSGAAAWAMSAAAAAEVKGPTEQPPVWTLVPTHIDRQNDTRVRLKPLNDPTTHFTLAIDRPVRIAGDGSFNVGGKPMQIAGIILPDRQKVCQTTAGLRWACGIRAQAVFVGLLTTKGLMCDQLATTATGVSQLTCQIKDSNLAERMIGDGWADPDTTADPPLKALAETARNAHRGIWRETMPEN